MFELDPKYLAVLALGAATVSSCGIGAAGAIAGASGGDDADPDQIEVDRNGSNPILIAEEPPEPAEDPAAFASFFFDPDEPRDFLLAEPSDIIEVALSQRIDADSIDDGDVAVSVQRPNDGEYLPVDVESMAVAGSRIFVQLREDTFLGARYRVIVRGVRSATTGTTVSPQSSFFVTREGVWTAPELVTIGSFAGGITISGTRDKYAAIEEYRDVNGFELISQSTIAGRFEDPWQSPTLVLLRAVANGMGPGEEVEFQTGRLQLGDMGATYRISEGDPNEARAEDFFQIMRAPVATIAMNSGFLDFGSPPLIFNTRPQSSMDANALIGRVDLPDDANPSNTPGLDEPHFTFNGQLTFHDDSGAAAFWSLSNPEDIGFGPNARRFETQKVYANEVVASQPGADWGPAHEISDSGVMHNSWPFMVRRPDGSCLVLWFSAASTTAELFDDTVDRYWMAEWIPGSGWQPTVDITPPGEAGSLPVITDVKFYERDLNGTIRNQILVMGRLPVAGGGAVSLPSVRQFDPSTMTWMAGTTPAGTTGVVLNDVLDFLDHDRFVQTTGAISGGSNPNLRYGLLRGEIRRATPKATSLGVNDFVIRWIDVDTQSNVRLVLANYDAELHTWGAPVVLDNSRVNISQNDPRNISANVVADQHGRATLIFLDVDAMTTNPVVKGQTVNLNLSPLSDFNDFSMPTETLSDPNFIASSTSSSNVHDSGAFAQSWTYRTVDPGGNPVSLGTSMARFR